MAEAVQQIATPTKIQQDPNYNTCGEAAIERQMASQDPAGYVDLLRKIVSKDETPHLAGGWRCSLNAHQIDSALKSDRSLASTLLQQSVHAAFRQGYAESALNPQEYNTMIGQAFPGKQAVTFDNPHAQKQAMGLLKDTPSGGTICMIGDKPDHLHAITVTGISKNGQVVFSDPNGKIVSMDPKIFQDHLHGMVGDKGKLPPDAGLKTDIGDGSGEATPYSGWAPAPTPSRGRVSNPPN